jgi:hypothetical protein
MSGDLRRCLRFSKFRPGTIVGHRPRRSRSLGSRRCRFLKKSAAAVEERAAVHQSAATAAAKERSTVHQSAATAAAKERAAIYQSAGTAAAKERTAVRQLAVAEERAAVQ